MTFLIKLIVNAFALWVTTLLLAPQVRVVPYEETEIATILSYLLIALIFGIVNGVIGSVVRVVAFPLYVLTLGLLALVVNALLLLLVAWVSSWFGFGLVIENFWWGMLGAVLLGVISWLLGLIIRPAAKGH